MKLLTGLFRSIRKSLLTTDNDMGQFREKINELVSKKDSLSDEEIGQRVEELKGICNDLPDDDGKAKLLRFLEDFKSVKEQDVKVAEEAAKAVADQFEKLDTEAMKDVPGTETAVEETTETVEEPVETKEVTSDEEEKGLGDLVNYCAETAKQDTAEFKKGLQPPKTEDADPNANYSLEEIYQFIKKRMAEDKEADAEKADEETTEEVVEETTDPVEEKKEEKDEEVTTDCAPRIPVTVENHTVSGSLSALFDLAKRG